MILENPKNKSLALRRKDSILEPIFPDSLQDQMKAESQEGLTLVEEKEPDSGIHKIQPQ